MNKVLPLFIAMVALLLCACGVQVQLQTWEPSLVNLRRGSSLRVYSLHYNDASRRLSKSLNRCLRESGFYSLGGTSATLYIEHALESETSRVIHTCSADEVCHCTEDVETTLRTTVRLELHGQILYRRFLSDTASGYGADYDGVAQDIVNDLVPHAVTYSVRIKPQKGNDVLEQAAEACRRGDWAVGQSLAKSSLQSYPGDSEAYYLLGIIARHHGDYGASTQYFSRAETITPSSRYAEAMRENAELQAKEKLARSQLKG